MKTWVHVNGRTVQYSYEPEGGKVLARTWRLQNGGAVEVCFHCDRSGQIEGELESETPHDAEKCDICGVRVMPREGALDGSPNPSVFNPDEDLPPLDLTDEEWESFDLAIREGRGR